MTVSVRSPPRRLVWCFIGVVILVGVALTFTSQRWSVEHFYILDVFRRPSDSQFVHFSETNLLLAQPLTTNFGVMPKIIHQSWMTDELPSKFEIWSRSCREKNPDWEWVLWTDEDNLNLVKKYFPWFLKYYQALPAEIYRADVVRNMYMYVYGGIYADLDTECLRPADDLFESFNITTVSYLSSLNMSYSSDANTKKAFFGRMGTDEDFVHSIPNAWMAATPGHPFFLLPLESVMNKMNGVIPGGSVPEFVTGPIGLRDDINLYFNNYTDSDVLERRLLKSPMLDVFGPQFRMEHTVQVLPYWYVYPWSWAGDGAGFSNFCSVYSPEYDREACRRVLETDRLGSYFMTYWSHSWSAEGVDADHMKNIDKDE
ncbi:nucleotide-diphospho-sugar transferase [Lipomyces kononenkoae]